MMKRLPLAMLLAMSLSGAALADAPASAEECNEQGAALAQKAEEKKLGDDKIAKVEELLMKLDEQCQGDKLAEAGATMKDLEGVIGD